MAPPQEHGTFSDREVQEQTGRRHRERLELQVSLQEDVELALALAVQVVREVDLVNCTI